MAMKTLPERFAAALDRLVPDLTASIGVAVSGGPDSLALLLLAHATRPGRIRAATVDHGLRIESAEEARFVADICARRAIPHDILPPPAHPIAPGQASARAFRYARLDRWCADHHLPFLMTGHHANDQAETLLMRLARGAGVAGLSGIRAVRLREVSNAPAFRPIIRAPDAPVFHDLLSQMRYDAITQPTKSWVNHRYSVIRPLLLFGKTALGRFVEEAGIVAVDDPSNAALHYDRTHFRALLGQQALLDPERLAATARNLADAEAALVWTTHMAYRTRIGGTRDLTTLDVGDMPIEILRRVIRLILYDVEEYVACAEPGDIADGPPLMRLIDRVRAGTTSTLGNVQVRGGAVWKFRPLWRPRRS